MMNDESGVRARFVPDEANVVAQIRAFLAAHNTMTVATVGDEGQPHAAAVFYAADDDLDLFFLSSPNSRHSQDLVRDNRVAATIHADGQAWQEIRGLQITGTAHPVQGLSEMAHAVTTYVARFRFLEGLLDSGPDLPATLRGPVASSRFYVLTPAWIRLIDNEQAFGHKSEVKMIRNGER